MTIDNGQLTILEAEIPRGSLLFLSVFPYVRFYRVERFFAYIMLYAACVFGRRFFVNAEIHEQLTQKRVSFVNDLRPFLARFREFDISVFIRRDESFFFEKSDRTAHGRF